MIAFGIGLAEFNAITTLIEQIIRPSGYSKVLCSIFAVLVAATDGQTLLCRMTPARSVLALSAADC